jgi:exonuclease V gamma subunit
VTFAEVSDAKAWLSAWIELFAVGQQQPLPLLERSSRAFVVARRKGANQEAALVAARKGFVPADRGFVRNDGDDEYVNLAFSSFEQVLAVPAPHDFVTLAGRIYDALLAHRSEA